jgi:phosphatidylinositol phospholipase C, delta
MEGFLTILLTRSLSRLKIEDCKYTMDTLAAWACIRLDRLQQGYRLVCLLDAKGQTTDGLLLVKIEKKIR